jgi:hypothetical protein
MDYTITHKFAAYRLCSDSHIAFMRRRIDDDTIYGIILFDPAKRKMLTVRGANIYDTSKKRVASLLDIQKTIEGAIAGMQSAALLRCFIR